MYTRLAAYVQTVSKIALGLRPAGHGVTVLPNDVFLVGHFRSGTTWSRFLFGNFVHTDEAVNAVLDAITEALKQGDKVMLTGFGSFEVREHAARPGRRPGKSGFESDESEGTGATLRDWFS